MKPKIAVNKLHQKLRDELLYNMFTGEFKTKTATTRCAAGDRVGTVRKDGTYIVSFNGELHTAGRLAHLWVEGSWPTQTVTLKKKTEKIYDYRWENLIFND